jgi:hypothetical protein
MGATGVCLRALVRSGGYRGLEIQEPTQCATEYGGPFLCRNAGELRRDGLPAAAARNPAAATRSIWTTASSTSLIGIGASEPDARSTARTARLRSRCGPGRGPLDLEVLFAHRAVAQVPLEEGTEEVGGL